MSSHCPGLVGAVGGPEYHRAAEAEARAVVLLLKLVPALAGAEEVLRIGVKGVEGEHLKTVKEAVEVRLMLVRMVLVRPEQFSAVERELVLTMQEVVEEHL